MAVIREALPERYRALADAGSGLGLRQGEAFGLAVEDADFLRGEVHIRRQVRIVASQLVFAPPKGGRERDMPLPESVKLRLAAHLAEFPAVPVTLPWKAPGGRETTARLIFTSRERGALNRNYVNPHLWHPAVRAAGMTPSRETGFHQLRHHFASVLLSGGVDIKALAEYLGHADPGFTLRVYTHLMPSAGERMRAAIDAAMGSGVQLAARVQ